MAPSGRDEAGRPRGAPGLAAFAAYILVRFGNLRPERVGRFPLVRSDANGMLTELVERDATPGPGDYLPRLEDLADKCLWGTDWPSPGVRSMKANVEDFLALPISDAFKERILGGNGVALIA